MLITLNERNSIYFDIMLLGTQQFSKFVDFQRSTNAISIDNSVNIDDRSQFKLKIANNSRESAVKL